MVYRTNYRILLLLLLSLVSVSAYSQKGLNSDALLRAARKAAFTENDYPKAKAYLFKALTRSPNYADVRIFLGRIYTWTDQYDSARTMFESVLKRNPSNEDATIAYADLEYYANNFKKSIALCNLGLKYAPKSTDLLTKKQRATDALNEPAEATQPVAATPATPGKETSRSRAADDSTNSADGLLKLARKAAFDEKNYTKALDYLYKGLKLSPDYADIKIFMGRIFVWTNEYDSATEYFESVLKQSPGYEDAIMAYSDMEYWNEHYPKALAIVEQGLRYHPASQDLLVKKGKILTAMKDYHNADSTLKEVLKINSKNKDALTLRDKIQTESTKNAISFTYDFSYFTKQFSNPWHMVSLDYGRVTDMGKIIGRFNYASRFGGKGGQLEIDAYPHISKTFYAYLNAGVAIIDTVGFPRMRAGFSLYANLPASFEAELGVRYLKFSGNPIFIYTEYLGRYIKNWLFSERLYLVPSEFSSTVSASFTFSGIYYIGGESADHLIGGNVGFGVSPDDRSASSVQLDGTVAKLPSFKANVFYKTKVSKFWVFSLSQGIFYSEYFPGSHGTEYEFSIGWLRRF
jgi:YaiO family outer membrane protein